MNSLFKSTLFKRLVKATGYALCAISLALLVDVFIRNYQKVEHFQLNTYSFFIFCLCILSTIVGHFNIVAGWFLLLKPKYNTLKLRNAYTSIGISQIAKYLPGNFAHFIGRAVLTTDVSSKADLTSAMFVETLNLIIVALFFASLWSSYFILPKGVTPTSVFLISALFIFFYLITIVSLRRKLKANWIAYRTLISILLLNTCSFFMHGFVVYLLSGILLGIHSVTYIQFTLGFSAAFLIGYLLPGAPGGIGVREYSFVLLFAPFLGEVISLEIIVAHRLLSIIGDLVFFLTAYIIKQSSLERR